MWNDVNGAKSRKESEPNTAGDYIGNHENGNF